MVIIKRGVLMACLLAGAVLAFSATVAWREFRSSKTFTVEYPADWFRQGISPDRLDILSSSGHLTAVVIEKGEADISVAEEPEPARRPLAEVIHYYENGAPVLLRKSISPEQPEACERLDEIVWKEAPVPLEDVAPSMRPHLTDFIYTGLFCQIKGRIVVLILKNWQGDKKQKEYQEIALRMAKSIRLPSGNIVNHADSVQ